METALPWGWRGEMRSLQDQALLLLLLPSEEGGARGVLKHLPHALVGLGRALEVFLGANLLADVFGLQLRWVSDRVARLLRMQRGRRTCSGVTGFCDVLCSSSIVFWSYLKSFLQPTRMMGRPWQKCRTSEIHCAKQPISMRHSPSRC